MTELRTLNELSFTRFESKLDHRFAECDAKLDATLKLGFAESDAKIAWLLLVHTRWMLGAWAMTFLAIIGLWFRK